MFLKDLDFCVQSRSLQIHLCLLQNLVLKVAYLHCSVVLEQIVELLVDLGQTHVYNLLVVDLETLALFWAIFNAPAHLISTPIWERLVVLIQI